MDHINKTSGLCLDHLRFLVGSVNVPQVFFLLGQTFLASSAAVLLLIQIIDEADRMIDSMHQAWLSQVVKAVFRTGGGAENIFQRSDPAFVTAAG